MEKRLIQRGIHFLRKAGVRKFILKTALWAQSSLERRFAHSDNGRSVAELEAKLSRLPVEDGHAVISVMDFTMKVRVDDPGLSKDLIFNGIRENDAVAFLRPHLSRCKSIVEIGANQGYYLIQEGLYSPANARIHAFEPHPENVKTAQLNIMLNGIGDKCRLVQAAISDKRGTAALNVSRKSNWHTLTASIEQNLEFSGGTIDVETFSLDEYAARFEIERVDFIRMDLEGHETAVMRGAAETVWRSPGILIFLEFHTSLIRQAGESPEEFLRDLRTMGLRCLTVCGKGKYLVEPTWDELIDGLELITSQYGTHMFFVKK
jgi:FkbM family methyltransferase